MEGALSCQPIRKKSQRRSLFMAAAPQAPLDGRSWRRCQGRGGNITRRGLVKMGSVILWRGLRQHRSTKSQRRSPSDFQSSQTPRRTSRVRQVVGGDSSSGSDGDDEASSDEDLSDDSDESRVIDGAVLGVIETT
ncbi:hypothetical protein NW764_011782 [Fusarium oxysporum]|nr:hypothetical protein NW764_011782 [Fusarium oxysporum]